MNSLSLTTRRAGAAVLLLVCAFCTASYLFEWSLFGRYNKQVMVGVFVLLFFYLNFFGSSIEEAREYRATEDPRSHASRRSARWRLGRYLASVLAVMVVVVLIGPVLQGVKGLPVQRETWVELVVVELVVVVTAIATWQMLKRRDGAQSIYKE